MLRSDTLLGRRDLLRFIVLMPAATLLHGCGAGGKHDTDNQSRVGAINGQVILDSKPLSRASILIVPTDRQKSFVSVTSSGEGRFSIVYDCSRALVLAGNQDYLGYATFESGRAVGGISVQVDDLRPLRDSNPPRDIGADLSIRSAPVISKGRWVPAEVFGWVRWAIQSVTGLAVSSHFIARMWERGVDIWKVFDVLKNGRIYYNFKYDNWILFNVSSG